MDQTEIAHGLRRARRFGWAALAVLGAVSLFGMFAQNAWTATAGRALFVGGIALGCGLAGYAFPLAMACRREQRRLDRQEYRRLSRGSG